MKFLIDQNRSPRLAELLRADGHDAVHTLELGLERIPDDELLALAASEARIIVSGDTDFGALLALRDRRTPWCCSGRGTPSAPTTSTPSFMITSTTSLPTLTQEPSS